MFIPYETALSSRVHEDFDRNCANALSLLTTGTEGAVPPPLSTNEIVAAVTSPAEYYEGQLYRAYFFDTLAYRVHNAALDAKDWDLVRREKNSLARQLDTEADFFKSYCRVRAIDPERIVELAESLLATTAEAYLEGFESIYHSSRPIAEAAFDLPYRNALSQHSERLTQPVVLELLGSFLEEAGITPKVLDVPSVTVTTHLATSSAPVRSSLIIANALGLEHLRSCFHAAGHALYALRITEGVDRIGVNIGPAELVAFLAQRLSTTEEYSSRFGVQSNAFFDFYLYYFARLYAISTLVEAEYYRSGWQSAEVLFNSSVTNQLCIDGPHVFRPGRRCNAVEFLVAFRLLLDHWSIESPDQLGSVVMSSRDALAYLNVALTP